MTLDHDICYRAVRSRDDRFDGRFFTGVTSTGIYCRPVCPARTPQRKNCTFLPSAAAAEAAGFRPCRRCRPVGGLRDLLEHTLWVRSLRRSGVIFPAGYLSRARAMNVVFNIAVFDVG